MDPSFLENIVNNQNDNLKQDNTKVFYLNGYVSRDDIIYDEAQNTRIVSGETINEKTFRFKKFCCGHLAHGSKSYGAEISEQRPLIRNKELHEYYEKNGYVLVYRMFLIQLNDEIENCDMAVFGF